MLPDIRQQFSSWYNEVIQQAGLIATSDTRGCFILTPQGYRPWEEIQKALDKMIKQAGYENGYFPLFIPVSLFSKEAKHVSGFATECAVVTHHRLKHDPEQGGIIVDPDSALEEPLVVRPTSEVPIWGWFKKIITSYRDLAGKKVGVNQWVNVVRWEMRTRPFLRTAEFLWQEGHTAHISAEEANAEARTMLDAYERLCHDYLALSPILGEKTENERFAGAEATYTLEGLMQDGKALQMGTSHFLGQNFAKAFEVQYTDADGQLHYVWGTSWGVTTRLIGAVVMSHGDQKGIIFPPRIAPCQAVIIPIFGKGTDTEALLAFAEKIREELATAGIRVKLDSSDHQNPGWKFAQYELQGVSLRLTIGGRELADRQVELTRRDNGAKELVPATNITTRVLQSLDDLHDALLARNIAFRDANTHRVDTLEEFRQAIASDRPGFIYAHWDGTTETELRIKEETKATIRCIPLGNPLEAGRCVYSGKPSVQRVLFAKAY